MLYINIKASSYNKRIPKKSLISKWLNKVNKCLNEEFINNRINKNWLNIKNKIQAEKQFITVLLIGKNSIKKLNLQYRHKSHPTNVLSFANLVEDLQILQIDIFVCYPIVIAEAAQYNLSIQSRFAHMIIHGYLHSLGFDHQTTSEQNFMEKLEIEIMHKLNFSNPYVVNESLLVR